MDPNLVKKVFGGVVGRVSVVEHLGDYIEGGRSTRSTPFYLNKINAVSVALVPVTMESNPH